jgi:hypothetical protein
VPVEFGRCNRNVVEHRELGVADFDARADGLPVGESMSMSGRGSFELEITTANRRSVSRRGCVDEARAELTETM